jgi:N-acetylneuraminic acid mutarotase
MPSIKSTVIIFMFCLILILPVNISFSPDLSDPTHSINTSNSELSSDYISEKSRVAHSVRENYKIQTSSAISMPEVPDSWNQTDWSGGPGQVVWSDTSKYNSSKKLNYTENEELKLDEGSEIPFWSELEFSPAGRARNRVVWNPTKEVFYLYGGESGSSSYSDELYEYNPVTNSWRRIGQNGAPLPRCSPVMVYDTVNDLLWIHGGNQGWGTLFDELWSYDPQTDQWQKKNPGAAPSARSDHAGAFNPIDESIIIWGGYAGDWENVEHTVYVYNISTNSWWQQRNYTKRYFNDGVWCPKTESVLFYSGANWYRSGSGHTLVDEFNEYFPNNDTWRNRSTVDSRIYPILAWDTEGERVIMHSGQNPSTVNDTYFYDIDTDTWVRTLDMPISRYTYDGDWDDKNNQFVINGGRSGGALQEETYAFKPKHKAYHESGELTSSVFSPGHRINPKSVTFNYDKFGGIKNDPIKIQLAGSDTTPEAANKFIGPSGSSFSYFTKEDGQTTPLSLKEKKYLAYKINISTNHLLHTPILNWVKINYYTYPASYNYESSILTLPENTGLPLRLVEWTSDKPQGTAFEIFFRQGQNNLDIMKENIFNTKLNLQQLNPVIPRF